MFVNPSDSFWTEIVKVKTEENCVFVKDNAEIQKVHIYKGQSFKVGERIFCFTETINGSQIFHQDREYLFKSLYTIDETYDFRVLWSEIDSEGNTYFDLIDRSNPLRFRYYYHTNKKTTRINTYEYGEGLIIAFKVKSIDKRGLNLEIVRLSGIYDTGKNDIDNISYSEVLNINL